MKTFLRNIPTRLYVQPAGGWTDDAEEALDFGGMRQALGFASQEGLSQMELVFPSGTLEPWSTVPLSALAFSCEQENTRDH